MPRGPAWTEEEDRVVQSVIKKARSPSAPTQVQQSGWSKSCFMKYVHQQYCEEMASTDMDVDGQGHCRTLEAVRSYVKKHHMDLLLQKPWFSNSSANSFVAHQQHLQRPINATRMESGSATDLDPARQRPTQPSEKSDAAAVDEQIARVGPNHPCGTALRSLAGEESIAKALEKLRACLHTCAPHVLVT